MLNLVTGVPGSSKTAYVVTQLDKIERENQINLLKNKKIFDDNLDLFTKYKSEFNIRIYEVGSGHELKYEKELLEDDYFFIFNDDFDELRPDDYFLKSVYYNEIIDRINNTYGESDFKKLLPVRTIYTNIKALKIPFVRANIYDWRQCPDGSIIVIDEVQLVEPYSDVKVKHEIVQDLTIHRHRGFDFWFITQSPLLLHPTIKELIGCHYHITRPYNRTPKIYVFGSCRVYPNTLVNKMNCEAKFSFKPEQRIFKLYKSTSIDTHKGRFPRGLVGLIVFILFGIFLFIYSISGFNFFSHFFGDGHQQIQKQELKTDDKNLNTENNIPASNDIPSSSPLTLSNSDIKYDVSKPYDFDESQYQYNIQDTPRLAGCIKMNNECTCYTQQATKIDISIKDCNRYISGDKPFNPFYKKDIQDIQHDEQQFIEKVDSENKQVQSQENYQTKQIDSQSQPIQQSKNPEYIFDF
uniref:ZOT protein n=1 Tax=Dulem virus 65 TaxID=3145776 RepID=A0AAU8BAV2_9VIRU